MLVKTGCAHAKLGCVEKWWSGFIYFCFHFDFPQVMDFSPEEVAAFVAMVGLLSVVAQVKSQLHC